MDGRFGNIKQTIQEMCGESASAHRHVTDLFDYYERNTVAEHAVAGDTDHRDRSSVYPVRLKVLDAFPAAVDK